ncbi:ShlB/FhaC/HecB family hemolysin secretion/activation protein [Azospirillum agricola]|uniref:ShlB/FhaC/HecB family hemolysin secretion/activation protein n=1 Tax=Azospirillum agricola TaxID=1720247 RepID=UPI000A0F044F|nr:ShlB/FhaC/HecB family hemolysin secretion/activation protein [Azospirillum agricola]SMH60757.1 Hemolysin activation/secretion protein [Azospirillum lipoferum]
MIAAARSTVIRPTFHRDAAAFARRTGPSRWLASRWLAVPAALLVLLQLSPDAALAQAPVSVERNLPPAVAGGGGGLRTADGPATDADDTPFGVDITGIRLIGLTDPVTSDPPAGITSSGVEGLDRRRIADALDPFLGQPLSRRRLAEVQAALAKAYREAGRPFVSVTAPPQEITKGVLQLRVLPFRTGEVRVREADGTPAAAGLADAVRAPSGALIEADRISEDLDWLNRFPYRQLNGVFEPGSDPGASDLTLEITRRRPWQAFAGLSNTGSLRSRSLDRVFIGFAAGFESLNDLTLSYQLTGSRDAVSDPGSLRLSGSRRPSYASHAGRIIIPTFARQALSLTPSFVATSQDSAGGLLTIRNTTVELPILYRSALSNIDGRLAGWGDLYGGVTPKWLSRKALSQGTALADGAAGVFDLTVGWGGSWLQAGGGSTIVDLRAVVNRAGLVPGNSRAAWNSFSNGRVEEADYAYLYGVFRRETPLTGVPWLGDLSWNAEITGQLVDRALPETEQLAIGGLYATRGYTLNDGSVDSGFVLRNEVRLPPFAVLGRFGATGIGPVEDAASPFAFLDVGHGHNHNVGTLRSIGERADTTLVGLGAGVDYTLGQMLQAGMNVGVALTDGPETSRGTLTAQARMLVSF